MPYIKVKDKNNLSRDIDTNAIINTDLKGYDQYKENYMRIYNQNQRLNDLENNVNEIKSDLSEIKNLLRNLAHGSW